MLLYLVSLEDGIQLPALGFSRVFIVEGADGPLGTPLASLLAAWPMDSRNSLPLLSQHWDYKCVCCHVWLSYGFWVSNSGPHAFTGLPLLSELSVYVISVVILLLNWYLILCIFTSLGFSRYVLVNLSVQKNSYALNGIYVGHVKVSFGNSDDNNDTLLLDYNW